MEFSKSLLRWSNNFKYFVFLIFLLACPFCLLGKGASTKAFTNKHFSEPSKAVPFFSIQTGCTYSQRIKVQALEVGNMVSWKTSDELNNAYFLVQCSIDGVEFKNVKQLAGAGTTQKEQHYQYLDVQTTSLRVFYRLRQVAYDGSFVQSETVICNRIAPNNLLIISMSSVETHDLFTVEVYSFIENTGSYLILDQSKNSIKEKSIHLKKGINSISIEIADLKNGRYELIVNAVEELERVFIKKVNSDQVPVLAIKE